MTHEYQYRTRSWQDRFMQRYYRSRPGYRDGTEAFLDLITRHAAGAREVLELGCGGENAVSTRLAQMFPAVDGLDVDDACRENKALRHAYVYDGGHWPVGAERYDAVIANYVLEHVEHVESLASELFRVLRSGGVFLFRTPNRWHYVSVGGRLIPRRLHAWIANGLRDLPEEADDPFRTYYRMNTSRQVQTVLTAAGFEQRELRRVELEPSYGMAHKGLFLLLMGYERLVNSCPELGFLRANLVGAFARSTREDRT